MGQGFFSIGTKFKNQIKVVSTKKTKNLYSKKNYININISNFKFTSKSDIIQKKLLKYVKKTNPKL